MIFNKFDVFDTSKSLEQNNKKQKQKIKISLIFIQYTTLIVTILFNSY